MTLVSRPVMMTLRQPRVTCPISFASCHIYTQYIMSLMVLSLTISSISVSGTYMTPSDCPIQTCLKTQFVPETDYFPVKLNVTMGNFAVDYYNHFKVLTNKYTGEQYVITLCGTPAPANNSMVARTISGALSKVQLNLAPTAKFMGPITKIAIDETITANVLELLGARSLIAAMEVTYITSPCLHALYEMKMISNFPSNTTIRASIIPNVDIVLSGNYAHAQPKWLQASITAELSPIGRLEWVKYLGALLNREYAAQTLYDDILGRYNTLKNQAMAVATKSGTPIVAWINYLKAFPPWTTQDTWTIKNADYQLQYTRDAGATPFTTNTTTYYNPMDAAAALLGGNVDIIIDETYIGYYPNGYSDFLEKWTFNGTYTSKFLTKKQVWRNDRMHTSTGGDDWFERAIIQIDAVLQDLISITQPSAVSTKQQRVWFRNYAENEGYGQTLDRCLDVSAPLFPILQAPVLKDPLCPNIPIETQAGYKPLPTPTPNNMNGVTTTTVQTGVVVVLMAIVAMVM